MALNSLEDAFKLREQAEEVIIEMAKKLVLKALDPASWPKKGTPESGELYLEYYKSIWYPYGKLMITESGLLKYMQKNKSEHFTESDVATSIKQLEKEKRIKYVSTSYWQYHQDNDVSGYSLSRL